MRLIDAEKLEDFLDGLIRDEWNKNASTSWADAFKEVSELVKSIPESVVRCKDCKWHEEINGWYRCLWWHNVTEPEVFCSMGERREDETD